MISFSLRSEEVENKIKNGKRKKKIEEAFPGGPPLLKQV
jgi:hypothetical protein